MLSVTYPLFDGFEFIGVVGVDLSLSNLFEDAYNINTELGHALVFDASDMRTFEHILLPQPRTVSIVVFYRDHMIHCSFFFFLVFYQYFLYQFSPTSELAVVYINELEESPDFQLVLDDVAQGLTGMRTVAGTRYLARGNPYRQGVDVILENLDYYYAPVSVAIG